MSEELPPGWEKRVSRSSGNMQPQKTIVSSNAFVMSMFNLVFLLIRNNLLFKHLHQGKPMGYPNKTSRASFFQWARKGLH